MPKYYVQSGPVQLVFDAMNARQAAVKAFEWTCERQSQIKASSALEHVLEAERLGYQCHDFILVGEKGFDEPEGEVFDTLDVVAAWQGEAFPWR
jgi:hypothetical protein